MVNRLVSVGDDFKLPAAVLGPLNATYAPTAGASVKRAVGTRWVFLGDSITAGAGASVAQNAYVTMTPVIAGRQIQVMYNAGIGGNTSGQMLARFSTDVLGKGADTLHLLAGTNDAGSAVPLATTIANIKAIVGLARQSGLAVILGTVPPRSSAATAAIKKATYAINLWLNRYAALEGIPLVDYHKAMVNTATGDLLAANDSGDGVHPSDAGHYAIASALAVGAASAAAGSIAPSHPVNTHGDPVNLIGNPLMLGTVGSSYPNAPGGWYFSGAGGTTAVLANDATVIGQYYSVQRGNTSGYTYLYYDAGTIPAGAVNPGDVLAFTFRQFTDQLTQPALTDVQVKVSAAFTDAAYANPLNIEFYNVARPLTPNGPSYFETVVPAGKSHVEVRLQLSTSATATTAARLKVAQVGLFNLTQLGVL